MDDDRANSIWVSIDDGGSFARNLMQIGVARCTSPQNPGCDGTMNQLFAWGREPLSPGCAGFIVREPLAYKIGDPTGINAYRVVHAGGQWRFQINGVTKEYIPDSSICWTTGGATWFGESFDLGDAIGGYAGAAGFHFQLTNALYEETVGGQWFSPSFNPGANCPRIDLPKYKCVVQNGQAVDFWTVQ